MRRLALLAVGVALALGLALTLVPPSAWANGRQEDLQNFTKLLNGSPSFLGTIVATTTKNNHDTATPFNNTGTGLGGKMLLVQPDTACYVYRGTANTATVTTANGVKLAADERKIITLRSEQGWLAALAVSGTCNLKGWEME
jgi:hypothetical protein